MTLSLKNLSLTIEKTPILKDITCRFEKSQLNGIIGVNGSGKSMLIKSILSIQKSCGTVTFNGSKLDPKNYSYISQSNTIEADFSVFEIVLLGLYQDLLWTVQQEQINKVSKILKNLHLEHLSHRKFNTLSGGQQQMVLLAQALVKEPQLILADEPTSALDIRNQLEYMTALKDYTIKNQATTLLVLHDLSLMCRFIDYFYLIENGMLLKHGPKEAILQEETLEDLYEVNLDISKTKTGYRSILPIQIK